MMRRLLIALAVLLVVVGCAGSPSGASPSNGRMPPPSAPAAPSKQDLQAARTQAGIRDCPASTDLPVRADGLPDVTLDCLGSSRRVRLSGLRGRPMVINIWAQWCRPCRLEAPHVSAVAKDAGNKVEFIGIDYADPDPAAAIEFARTVGWRYPQLRDPRQQVKGPLKIIGVPQTFLVDAHGRIVYRQLRPLTSDAQLRTLIHDHLGVAL